MNKNLPNDDDDLFRKAYQNFEDEPSPEVWEKINAQLDKKDALYFRNRVAMWKRIAAMLLLLLSSFIAYELFFANDRNSNLEHKDFAGKRPLTNQSAGTSKNQHDSLTDLNNEKATVDALQNILTQKNKTDQHKKTASAIYKQPVDNAPARESKTYATTENTNTPVTEEKENEHSQDVLENNIADSLHKTPNSFNKDNEATKTPDVAFEQNSKDSSFNKANTATGKKNNKTNTPFKKYWAVTPYASFDFIGQRVDNDGSFPDPVEPEKIQQREHQDISFTAGLLARYQFQKKLSFKTGLSYSNSSTAIEPQTLYAKDSKGYTLITTSGYTYLDKVFGQQVMAGDSVYTGNTEHHISNLNIPLMAGYTINPQARLTITPGAGIYTHIIIGSKIETEIKKDGNKETVSLTNFKGQRPVYFSFAADAEISYKLSKKLKLAAMPSFMYAINSMTNKNAVKTYPYSFRLGAGLTWNLED